MTILPRKILHRMLLIILIAVVVPAMFTGWVLYLQRGKALRAVDKALKTRFSEIEEKVTSKTEEMGKTMVRQKALDVALEIELYLKLHPSTVKELINDSSFQSIGVQPIGEKGYTFVIAPALNLTVAHPIPGIKGKKYPKIIASSPKLVRMFSEAQKGRPVEGTYLWSKEKGSPPVEKFAFLFPIAVKTKDSITLVAGATSCVSEFIKPISLSKDVFRSAVVKMKRFLQISSTNLVISVMGIFLISIILGGSLAFLIASNITTTITALKEGMERVNKGDLLVRIDTSNTGELKELEEDFNVMVEKLRSTTISQEFLETVIHSLPSGIALVDNNMKILFWNREAENLTGFAEKEAKGRRICELLSVSSDHEICGVSNSISPSSELDNTPIVRMITSKSETKLYFLFQYSKIDHPHQKEVAGVISFIDITRQQQLEQQLAHVQKMEAIGVLAAGIAHDFNNMLGAILGNLNLISMTAEEEGNYKEIAEYAYSAEKVVHQAAQVTRRLLAFTKQTPMVMKTINPALIIKETIEILSRTIDKRISVVANIQSDLWNIKADPAELQQILMNLCLNAKDALMERIDGRCEHKKSLKEDPPRLVISVENQIIGETYVFNHPSASPGRFVRFVIYDNGCGMGEDTLDKIFNPFFTTKELEKGTGLGLATVYGLVKQHNGWIAVESKYGEGSRFEFYIPALIPTEPTKDKSTSRKDAKAGLTQKISHGLPLTILLVDDEEPIRKTGKTILEHMGHKVILAENGEKAIKLYEERRPDLVILDITMPVLSGKDALKRIMEIDPEAKVVISSGHPFESSAKELLDLGAKLYLQKPFRIKDIKEAIEKVFD